jgi:hypothetical protein
LKEIRKQPEETVGKIDIKKKVGLYTGSNKLVELIIRAINVLLHKPSHFQGISFSTF